MPAKIQENHSLAPYTTFKIGGTARYFVDVQSEADLKEALALSKREALPLFILGGGSNVLINDVHLDKIVIHMNIKGFEVIEETDADVIIRVAAGEIWDEIVAKVVAKAWWGIENLSHIPGKVGSAPIQNIGAYGQEISEVIETVEVLDTQDGNKKVLTNAECLFGYRRSIFNQEEKGRYITLHTTLRLSKKAKPVLSYKDLQNYFQDKDSPTLQEIREAVITIRDAKLPHPDQIGNAGSFFKNLILSEEEYEVLNKKIAQNFPLEIKDKLESFHKKLTSSQGAKIPTGFLIEICDLKGTQIGGAKIHDRSGLVIINENGEATAEDVMKLFQHIRQIVFEKTGMKITHEPEWVNVDPEQVQEYFALQTESVEV